MTLPYYNYNNWAWAEDEEQSAFSLRIREGGTDETLLTTSPFAFSSRPCGSAAQRRNENKFVLGRAAPSQTLPRVGEGGNPVSPHPSPRAYFHVRETRRGSPFIYPLQTSTNWMQKDLFWKGCALPRPPAGGGVGKPGFPLPLLEDQALPQAGAWGNRVSPHPCSSSLFSR